MAQRRYGEIERPAGPADPGDGGADPLADVAHALGAYLWGERQQAILTLVLVLAAAGLAALLLRSESPFRLAAYPVLGAAAFELGAAGTVFLRAARLHQRLRACLAEDPDAFLRGEPVRLARVRGRLGILVGAAAAAAAVGAFLALRWDGHQSLHAVGLGTLASGAGVLALAAVSRRRTARYARWLEARILYGRH